MSFSGAYCQKIFSSKGQSTVRIEDHLSRAETIEIAREQAKIAAIEKVFGSYINRDAYVDVEDGQSDVAIKSGNHLKGEWLKTNNESIREELRKLKNPDGKGAKTEVWLVFDIEGKVREITTPTVDFKFAPSNCLDLNCETSDFKNGDSFFLHFKTPVDGYLSVYLASTEEVFRLLPYSEMPSQYLHNVPVRSDVQYLFFSPTTAQEYFEGFHYYYTDEIMLDTDLDQEFYKLYVIFSEKPFSKPILDEEVVLASEFVTPKSMTRRHFDVWVQDSRIFDTEFYYKTANIRVRK